MNKEKISQLAEEVYNLSAGLKRLDEVIENKFDNGYDDEARILEQDYMDGLKRLKVLERQLRQEENK